jgi:sialate O-acetylesterase
MGHDHHKSSQIRLAGLFTSHAVLQRNMPVPVWGVTRPDIRVKVTLGEVTAETRSDSSGKFMLRLPPMPAGGPYDMIVLTPDPDDYLRLQDIMVGEVWLCSGQSNMGVRVAGSDYVESDLGPDDHLVRSFNVPCQARLGRRDDVKGEWVVASSKTIPNLSAVGFFFCRRLATELGVPVGIIHSSWGGTRIEAWISREELVRHEWTRNEINHYESYLYTDTFWNQYFPFEPDDHSAFLKNKHLVFATDPGNEGVGKGWAESEFNDTSWDRMELPTMWQYCGHNFSGVFWFRREVVIPESWAGRDLKLEPGKIDKHDVTYFNGVEVGATGSKFEDEYWDVPRSYSVPGELVKPGRAVIAIRVNSFMAAGGIHGEAEMMRLAPVDGGNDEAIGLAGAWRYGVEQNYGLVTMPELRFGPSNQNSPYMLNDNMIQPLIPYAIRGVTWYQGERNTQLPYEYDWMLRAMIQDWRRAWGEGDFPFITVQLANFAKALPYQERSDWALVREAQVASLAEPETGLTVTIDIGDAYDIHPRNKVTVGERMAKWALARTYGKGGVCSGPLYRNSVIEGGRIRIYFDHVGEGLIAKGGELKTFMIAGTNRLFKAAEARIEGSTVVVESAEVTEPAAVRYAWADNPDGCNLYNSADLPASPFRTDQW